tara:strand:- start:205 stop:414 length:210 start_codon:yes stop_codon:yes gene_type:complete
LPASLALPVLPVLLALDVGLTFEGAWGRGLVGMLAVLAALAVLAGVLSPAVPAAPALLSVWDVPAPHWD